MDKPLLDDIAASLAKRADAFECFGVEHRYLGCQFEAGKLKIAQTSQRGGVGLRVVVGGRMAVGGTPDPTAVARTIDATIEAATFGDPCEFAFAPAATAAPIDVHYPSVPALAADELVKTGWQIVERLADLAREATVSVGVGAGEHDCDFLNSAGQQSRSRTSSYGVSASIEFFGPDDIFSVWESQDDCAGRADLDELVASVRRKFEQARQVVPVGGTAGGRQPVIFSPQGLSGLLAPLLAGLNGQNVADGVSPLADKRGGPIILDEKFTLIDDGTLSNRPGSQPFDDEGVPTRRTVLIGAGRVENFLLDLRTAGKLGLASTGNAGRGLTSPPVPHHGNLIVQPGDTPVEQMLGELTDGLLIESLLGVGQGNVLAGDYSNTVGLGYKIRDGRIVGRVKNVSIAGNLYQDLKHIAAIEDRGHWHGSTCLPHLRLDGLTVASAG